jgi:Type VI secretion, TssG
VSVLATLAPPELTDAERRLVRRAPEFDVRALLSLLAHLGYPPEDVQFRSNPDNVGARTLVHALELLHRPHRRALVTLNMGLLGENGLLPSYFQRVIDETPEPERFYDFVAFFEHRLLQSFFSACYPESYGGLFGDFGRVRTALFHMLGMGSVSTLQWLFGLFFPELRVTVRRRAFRRSTASHALRVGMSRLDGTSVVGRVYESDASGFGVRLYAEEELRSNGVPWPHTVRERLEKLVLPLLAPFDIPLVVSLFVATQSSWAELGHEGYLGWDRLKSSDDSGLEIVVFHGRATPAYAG